MNAPVDITDAPLGVYAKRKGVYPKAVDGFYRRLKWAAMIVTLTIYYVTPWLRWERGAYAPNQAVLVDLAHRRFFMFAIEIWPQEFYYVAGLLIMAGMGLFLVTSAVGRAWCGYACPQTVWTDLYQHIERFIDGDRNAQVRLARAPWEPAKLGRRLFKWTIWLLIAVATGGAWIFYFADAPTLASQFLHGTAPFVAYAAVGILTATTFIFGGFMREQVCIYMCPWPRIQTAMMDEKSLLVTYRDWRGEPRGSVKTNGHAEAKFGDCIDCNQCAAVCPTGIDIRNGPDIGCITCGLCIDACDKVMAQIGRPRGLIDYLTLEDADTERAGHPPISALKTLLRPRTFIYLGLWCAVGLAMLFTLESRTRLAIAAGQERNPLYVQLSGGAIRNSFILKLRNMEDRPRVMSVQLSGLNGATIWQRDLPTAAPTAHISVTVPADSVSNLPVFVEAPSGGNAHTPFTFRLTARDTEGGAGQASAIFEKPEPTS